MAVNPTSPAAQTPGGVPLAGDTPQSPEQTTPQPATNPTPGGSLKEQALNAADGLLEQGCQLAGITTFQKPANHFERVRIAYDVFQALSKTQQPEVVQAFVDGLKTAGASLGLNQLLQAVDTQDDDRLSKAEIKAAGTIEVPQGMGINPAELPAFLEPHRKEHDSRTGIPIDAAIESIMTGLPTEPASPQPQT